MTLRPAAMRGRGVARTLPQNGALGNPWPMTRPKAPPAPALTKTGHDEKAQPLIDIDQLTDLLRTA